MEFSKRISSLPPYLFAEIDKKIEEKKAQGCDVISLGIGDPVEPTPKHIIEKLAEEAQNTENHRYPSYYGMPQLRKSIADFYKRRFSVDLDPDKEVLPLIGSKEGLAHIYLALCDEGDTALIPDPGYPVYQTGAIIAGVKRELMPLLDENKFNPDFSTIDENIARQAKLMWLCYPNNPTGAIAKDNLFEEAIRFAKKNDIAICHDNPYSEITFDGYIAPSFLQYEGAKDMGIEFNSLSKTYNMTGWRIGYVVGNARIIEALGRVKTNVDSGIFNAVQLAGIEALNGSQESVEEMRKIYKKRRDMVVSTLKDIGLAVEEPKATIYVWVPVPEGYTSESFATHILEKASVVVPPGNAYGPSGEGFIRISLTTKDDRLEEALKRIKECL
ncbi:MAG: LL-diaminopimelate aminotransferase [Actinobacteria bacterium]|nr:MAG: LL-diaminopimelate aminotransferase [Actinomycetota bacterium]